jgi:immunoglobulin-like protein involved in spore germination
VRRSFALVLVLAGVVLVGCTKVNEVTSALSPSPSASTSSAPTGPTGRSVAPDGKSAIVVKTPRSGDDVVSGVTVSGTAFTGSGKIAIEILGDDGRQLAASLVDTSCGADCRGRFSADLAFIVVGRENGIIRLYEPSSQDGTALHTTELTVGLVPGV